MTEQVTDIITESEFVTSPKEMLVPAAVAAFAVAAIGAVVYKVWSKKQKTQEDVVDLTPVSVIDEK